jgi:hypothetical protein
MAYVDLNPVRAAIVPTPEDPKFTSVQARLQEVARSMPKQQCSHVPANEHSRVRLLDFADTASPAKPAIPYRSLDYLELIDWSGRSIRDDKRGSIDRTLPSILQRLNIDRDAWQQAMRPAGNLFGRAMGRLDHLRLHAALLEQSWVRGLQHAARLYPVKG